MTAPGSISRQLVRRILALGAAGAALLLAFVAIEYRLSGYRDVLGELAEHVFLPLVILVLPMVLAGRWVVKRSLAPLDRAAAQIEASGSADRGFRVPDGGLPEEALPFVAAVNRLLERLDEAAARHEAFAGDIAHELKTPLAVLSLELDGLDHPVADRLRRQVKAMSRLVDQLMLLAQLEADRVAGIEEAPASLAEIAAATVELMAPQAAAEGKQVALDVVENTVIPVRREAVGSALRNLIENGLRVSAPEATVTIRVGPGAVVAVQDAGPGLKEAELARFQERHQRADHFAHEGAGLGLAITTKIMADHGGRLVTVPERRELQLQFQSAQRT